MRPPRGLTADEAAAWRRITATVTPLDPVHRSSRQAAPAEPASEARPLPAARTRGPEPVPPPAPPPRPASRPLDRHGLDASWERRLARAEVSPELAVDLHGLNLDQAHATLMTELGRAMAGGVRVVLLVTGKARGHDDPASHAERGQRRGAIRAKLLDWLAASGHADNIAAVRPAHPRHGGAGAVYIVLRRGRR